MSASAQVNEQEFCSSPMRIDENLKISIYKQNEDTNESRFKPNELSCNGPDCASSKDTEMIDKQQQQQQQQQQQEQVQSQRSECSSVTDNRSSSSSSAATTRSRAGSSTTSMSKFKEKRPEPLKLNPNVNQEIPLDLSVKSAGNIPSGTLSNIFNLAGINQMTTLETPRIVWQDNDALLIKSRLFSSSTTTTNASSQRLRLSSLAGDSPPMTPGTPTLLVGQASPSHPAGRMLHSARSQTALYGGGHQGSSQPSSFHKSWSRWSNYHYPQSKPLSASYAVQDSSQSLQALMSAHLEYNKHRLLATSNQAKGRSSLLDESSNQISPSAATIQLKQQQQQYQYQAMLNAATVATAAKLHSPFHVQFPSGLNFDAYLRAPRRSCSTENLTSSLVAAAAATYHGTRKSSQPVGAQSNDNHQHNKQTPRRNLTNQQALRTSASSISPLATKNLSSTDTVVSTGSDINNRFSYSGQQIAAAAAEADAEFSKSESPIINVISGSPSSSTEDSINDNSSGTTSTNNNNNNYRNIPGGSAAGIKARSPTSVANATANLLNIRLNSPTTNTDMTMSQTDQSYDPLISATYCREQQQQQQQHQQQHQSQHQEGCLSWGSANDAPTANSSSHGSFPVTGTGSISNSVGLHSSLSSVSTTLNTPTLTSPNHRSTCFLASPTLSPMSSVFELPSPLLMFPPPTISGQTTTTSSTTDTKTMTSSSNSSNNNDQVVRHRSKSNQRLCQATKMMMSDPSLAASSREQASSPYPLSGGNAFVNKATFTTQLNHQQQQQQQQEAHEQFSTNSEGNLAHLVTSARDKTGIQLEDELDNPGEGNMEIDSLELDDRTPLSEQASDCRPATAIPRILVSNHFAQRQQHNGCQATAINQSTQGQYRAQRESVSKRALSPQSFRAHINVYHRERLESSSAPPDVYQGRARSKVKSITGSQLDFYCSQDKDCVISQSQQSQRSNHYPVGENQMVISSGYHQHSKSNGHSPYPSMSNFASSSLTRFICRPSSAEPPLNRSSNSNLYGTQPSVDYIGTNQRQLNQNPAPQAQYISQLCDFSHSAQQLQRSGYSASGSQHQDPSLIPRQHQHQQQPNQLQQHHQQHQQHPHPHQQQQHQSVSAGDLHRSPGIQLSLSSSSIDCSNINNHCADSSMMFHSSNNQLMTAADHQPDQVALRQQQQHHHFHQMTGKQRTVVGLDRSMAQCQLIPSANSLSELDSVLHQTPIPVLVGGSQADQSPIAISRQQPLQIQGNHHHHHQLQQNQPQQQPQQQQQRASSACSLSRVTNSTTPDGFPINAATSFRSSSVAESSSSAGSQQNSVAAAAKKYRCDECSKAFTRSDMLTRHKRLHSGDRPFQCNECKQEFSRSDHLSTHMRTHTGEKPYKCKLCSYSACRKDMITRHMKVHNRSSPNSALHGQLDSKH